MIRISTFAAASLLFGLLSLPASAQEWILGAGYSQYSRPGSEDSAQISIEYHAAPFFESGRISSGLAAVLSAQATGDTFVGVGLVARLDFDNQWFLETSVIPGAYFESSIGNDLGSTFEIRSLIGVGYQLDPTNSVSLALAHKSNASTAAVNPGVNTLLLRWHRAF